MYTCTHTNKNTHIPCDHIGVFFVSECFLTCNMKYLPVTTFHVNICLSFTYVCVCLSCTYVCMPELHVCMYVCLSCMYVCMHVCMYVDLCTLLNHSLSDQKRIDTHTYTYIHVYIYIHTHYHETSAVLRSCSNTQTYIPDTWHTCVHIQTRANAHL